MTTLDHPVQAEVRPSIRQHSAPALVVTLVSVLFAACCLGGIWLLVVKRQALAFHPVDYPYFIQTTSQLLERHAHLSINPEGFSCFGFYGMEGAGSIHRSIHVEPVKYFWALAGHLFQLPLFVFLFIGVVYFLPVLYFAVHQPIHDRGDALFGVLIAAIYCLYPSAAHAVTFDLRPFSLLAPAFVMCILAVHFRRPMFEKWLLLTLMFMTREESIMLGAVAILYAFCRRQGTVGARVRALSPLIVTWGIWLLVLITYYTWADYATKFNLGGARRFGGSILRNPVALGTAACGAAVIGVCLFRMRRFAQSRRALLALCSALVPFAGMYYLYSRNPQVRASGELDLLYSPRWTLCIYMGLLLCIQLWSELRSGRARRMMLAGLCLLAAALIPFNFVGERSICHQGRAWWERRGTAEFVFRSAESVPRNALLVCDYDTCQALADRRNLLVYNRLPPELATGSNRFFPANKTTLADYLRKHRGYMIVSSKGERDLREVAQAGVIFRPMSQNAAYQLLEFEGTQSIATAEP